MAKKISITNSKGGVGKSSVSQHLGAGMARVGKSVLLVDLDPNGTLTNCTYGKGIDKGLADAFTAVIKEEDVPDVSEMIVHTNEPGVDLLPASGQLAFVELRLPGVMGCDFVLKELLEPVEDKYDIILFDCPGNMNKLTANALIAADSVIIPIQPNEKSIDGLDDMIGIITRSAKRENPGLKIEGLLINMFSQRVLSARDAVSTIRLKYDNVFMTMIPMSCREPEAAKKKESIFEYDGRGKIAKAYEELTAEVLGIEIKSDDDDVKLTVNM